MSTTSSPDGDDEDRIESIEDEAVFPYKDGTSGWSGSETSRDRAISDDLSGRTVRRWAVALRMLDEAGPRGLTVTEFGEKTDGHHGTRSGSLSNLHKQGRIARLTEVRNRCKVYVSLDHVQGRPTEPQGRKKKAEAGLIETPAVHEAPATAPAQPAEPPRPHEEVGPASCGCTHATCRHGSLFHIDSQTPRTKKEQP